MNYAEKEQIFNDFEKLIKFYSRRSLCEFMEDDLQLFLFELMYQKRCISKRYVAVCLRNRFFAKQKEFHKFCERETLFDFWEFAESNQVPIDLKVEFTDILKRLNPEQQNIIVMHYYYGYSIAEIADKINLSRQTVNKNKNQALDKMRSLI